MKATLLYHDDGIATSALVEELREDLRQHGPAIVPPEDWQAVLKRAALFGPWPDRYLNGRRRIRQTWARVKRWVRQHDDLIFAVAFVLVLATVCTLAIWGP